MSIKRVSTAGNGAEGNGYSSLGSTHSALSSDGRFVVFQSNSTNLVPGDTNRVYDVFLKDLTTGAITRVDTAADGTQSQGVFDEEYQVAYGHSGGASISANGRFVVFESQAKNLVPNGSSVGNLIVFVKDLQTGAITAASTTANGTDGHGQNYFSSISADGRFVAFVSNSTDLVPGDTNNDFDVFVKDLTTGAITRVSTAADGTQGNGDSELAQISADGRSVVFVSSASNLVPGDTNGIDDIFVRNLSTGAITRVSTAADGTQASGGSASYNPAISADGRFVLFESGALNLVPGQTNSGSDIFVKDLVTGAITRVNVRADGAPIDGSIFPDSISADGTRVLFGRRTIDPGNPLPKYEIFVKDLRTGELTLVPTGGGYASGSMSADGLHVAFSSDSANLVPGDTNDRTDIFVTLACFVTGTRILTNSGQVSVEALGVGDVAVTASGAHRPIRWIGHRHVDVARHPDPQAVRPVRIAAGAFGEDLPCRDLIVSPDHAILCGDVLIPAKCLLNGATVVEDDRRAVTYWHVELDSHDLLLAENLPAESYLDCGNRSGFAHSSAPVDLHPDFAPGAVGRHLTGDYCRPYVDAGPDLAAARSRLRQCAESLGWTAAPFHPDLRAVVDGSVVRPTHVGSEACFALPPGARSVRLVSDTFSPQDFSAERADTRRLGVLVRGLAVTHAGGRRDVALDDASLGRGFHALEGAGRWTDGDARLDLGAWAGPTLLHVKIYEKPACVWQRPAEKHSRRSA